MEKRILALLGCVLLVLAAGGAQANLLTGYSHGDNISELPPPGGGVGEVTSVNNLDGDFQFGPDEAVAFDSDQPSTQDPDLVYGAGWAGGNIATNYGNNRLGILMILPDNTAYASNPSLTNDTEDGGTIEITFDTPLTSFDFSAVDVEDFEADDYSVTFYDDDGTPVSITYAFSDGAMSLTARDGTINWGGDNTANYIIPFTLAELQAVNGNFDGIDRVEFTYGGSGGIALGAPVPVPGAVWLLGSGLVALLGFQRRRRS